MGSAHIFRKMHTTTLSFNGNHDSLKKNEISRSRPSNAMPQTHLVALPLRIEQGYLLKF